MNDEQLADAELFVRQNRTRAACLQPGTLEIVELIADLCGEVRALHVRLAETECERDAAQHLMREMTASRNRQKARAEQAERERDDWRKRAEDLAAPQQAMELLGE